MALKLYGGEVTVTGTATSLFDLLTNIGANFAPTLDPVFTNLAVRASRDNVGKIYFGIKDLAVPPATTAHGYIDPGEAVGIPLYLTRIHANVIYFIAASAGDKIFVSAVEV